MPQLHTRLAEARQEITDLRELAGMLALALDDEVEARLADRPASDRVRRYSAHALRQARQRKLLP